MSSCCPPNLNELDVPSPWAPPQKKFQGTPTSDDEVSVMSCTSLNTRKGKMHIKMFLKSRPKDETESETIRWVGENPCESMDLLRLITVKEDKHVNSISKAQSLIKTAQTQQKEDQASIENIDIPSPLTLEDSPLAEPKASTLSKNKTTYLDVCKEISINWIDTKDQLADYLTKLVNAETIQRLWKRVMGW